MCFFLHRSKRSVTRDAEQCRCSCPKEIQNMSEELTRRHTCRTGPSASTACAEQEKRVLISDARQKQTQASRSCKLTARSRTTGKKAANMTFPTLIDTRVFSTFRSEPPPPPGKTVDFGTDFSLSFFFFFFFLLFLRAGALVHFGP